MKPNQKSKTNVISERELKSKSKSTISFQTQTSALSTNRRHSHNHSNSSTASPVMSRKILKSNLKRRNSVPVSSNFSRINESMVSSQGHNDNEIDEPDDTMDYDFTERTTTSNSVTDEIISDAVLDDDALNGNQDDHLNYSIETVDEVHQVKRTTTATKKDVMKYFTRQPDGNFKCNLCTDTDKLFCKTNETSDTNLRSHLGKMHRMVDFLYPSQKHRQNPNSKTVPAEEKKTLDDACIEAIAKDALPFNQFSKPGMMAFLSIIKPGYRPPHRKTVRKRLGRLYQQKRQLIKQELSPVRDVSLTTDVWKSPTRQYFICLTCHFLTASLENKSIILSFRRFPDKHSGQKFRSFIRKELKKMGLEHKIFSITTDGGSDIKCATGGAEFGMRIACSAHNLTLVVKKALWLFEKVSSKSKSSSTATASKQNDENNVYDDYDDEMSTIDDRDELFDQDFSENEYDSDVSEEYPFPDDSTSTYISSDEDFSDAGDEDEDGMEKENEEPTSLRFDENNQRQNNEQTVIGSVSNPETLQLMIHNLLKRVRQLIGFIRQSSVLDRYVRRQIKLKQKEINRRAEEQNAKPIK